MTHGPRYRVKPRRRREERTDYKKRLTLLKSDKTRMVVRKSLKQTRVQFIKYDESGDKIVATAVSKELESKHKWKFSTGSTPAAYLTGLMAGKRALDAGVKECILDIGNYPPVTGSKVFACLKGALDAGVKCPHSESKIPDENRLFGKHIDENMVKSVEKIKNDITGGK